MEFVKEQIRQATEREQMQNLCWRDYLKYVAENKTEMNSRELIETIESAIRAKRTEINTALPSDEKVIHTAFYDILEGAPFEYINWCLDTPSTDWATHVDLINSRADRIGDATCNLRGLGEYQCLLYLKLAEFKTEIEKSLDSGDFKLPQVCFACDSFAIDLANQNWSTEEILNILKQLSQGVFSYQVLIMLMRKMPQRFLQHCADMCSKLRPSQKYSHCISFFLNILLYCHVGGMDYYASLTSIQQAINMVALENNENQFEFPVPEVLDDPEEILATAKKLIKLNVAEGESVQEELNSENQSDSSTAQSGTAKTLLKGVIGFGTFIALCSLGFPPHLTPVVTPVINTAVEKAF